MISPVNPDDIRAFARRDWAAIADAKAAFWASRKQPMTPVEALEIAEMLRQHVLRVQPNWPDDAEREADLAIHVRISEVLRAVSADGPG
jgi:hypothetical protein